MPQPIDFTEFFCCFYINFLSINGIIEVPPHTIGGENLWLIIIISFHLKILSQIARTYFWMVSLPSSNFWNSILMFHFSFHKPFITPFISTLVAKEIICLPVSFQLSSCKFSIPTDILIIRSLIQSRIMTIIPKQLLMCPNSNYFSFTHHNNSIKLLNC